MRTQLLAIAFVCGLSLASRADDNKPPVIADVRASATKGKVQIEARISDETGVLSAICHHRSPGGRVEDSPMQKADYGDQFKVSFNGSGDSEYWIEATDLLGNGPSTYGSQSKPFTASGKAPGKPPVVAAAEPAPKPEPAPKAEPAPRPEPVEHHRTHHEPRTASTSGEGPQISHSKPSIQPPEGKDFTLRIRIHSGSSVSTAVLQARPQGSTDFNNMPLAHQDGDSYTGTIPADLAKGTVEYFVVARNDSGAVRQGDGDNRTPYTVTFRPGTGAASTAQASSSNGPSPFSFTDNPPFRVAPDHAILVRAQVVPATDGGAMPEHVQVLWRGADAQDQISDMTPDPNGGWGGYRVELPAQPEGAIFYQVIACDAQASSCAIDTGSKRKWHATAVAAQPGGAQPMPLDAVSTKAPSGLPD